MKPVFQTRQGGPTSPADQQGDCFRACICSLLELPIDAIPNPAPGQEHSRWEAQWQAILAGYGFWMVGLDMEHWTPESEEGEWWVSPGYWIASVLSRNLKDHDGEPVRHSVIMKGRSLAHDPQTRNPRKRVTLRMVKGCRWLVPLDYDWRS